jgi:Tfp pilus assembly protein PilF
MLLHRTMRPPMPVSRCEARHRLARLALATIVLSGVSGCTTDWLARFAPASAPPAGDTATAPLQLAELSPRQQAHACLVTAQSLAASGYDAEAIALYERASTLDPDLALQLAHPLAVLYDRRGDNTRALHAYRQALSARPHCPEVLNDLGVYYLRLGQLPEAEQHLRLALQRAADSPRIRVNLGICLARQRRYQEAYEQFASALDPAAAHSNIGVIAARNGDVGLARAALRQALQHDPTLRQPQIVLNQLDGPAIVQAAAVSR